MTDTKAGERAVDWMTKSRISGLAALVVGGGSGIGEAAARMFAANGASVMIAGRHEDSAERVAAEIGSTGGGADFSVLDVSNRQDVAATVEKTMSRFGRLDALINTAAFVKPATLATCSLETWRACFEVNVDGALLLARACLPHLRKSPAAAIVTVGSLGGVWGRPNGGAYGPSKAALMTLTRQMALEWAPDGVRVNIVIPGTIETPLARATVPANVLAERAAEIPMGRLGSSEEMADLSVFLASPAASYITAQVFTCDGGHSQSMFHVPMGTNAPRRF